MSTNLEEQLEQALYDMCRMQDKPKLPELWMTSFPVCLRSVAMMERGAIRAWFCGFRPANKHGMWWSYSDGVIKLHGTRGDRLMLERLTDAILWLQSLEEEKADPGRITNKNLTLLTKATEAYRP